MRKHIYGFALFVFIVTCGVTAYSLFLAPTVEVKPTYCRMRTPLTVNDPDPIQEISKPAPLTYKIKSFHIDLEKGVGTAEVRLDWYSVEKPPLGVRLDFGVTTPGEPYSGIMTGSYYVRKPFKSGRSSTVTCTFKTAGGLDPKVKNYYGFAEVTEADGIGDGYARTVLVEKNRMAGAIPVLMGHPNKK